MELFHIAFLDFTLIDLIDILVVATIVYQLIKILKGTQAFNMIIGLGIILFVAFISTWLRMESVQWLMTRIGAAWVLIFLIVFQPELRNILVKLGNNPLWRKFIPTEESAVVPKIVEAVKQIQKKEMGALIVIERDVGLLNYTETGKEINSQVIPELLVSIFTPPGPLHDGAAIISGNMISAAGCTLPLSENPEYTKTHGMRHRAGIGATEKTDAISIIVSEETGKISLALRGHLRKNIDPSKLEKLLDVLLNQEKR